MLTEPILLNSDATRNLIDEMLASFIWLVPLSSPPWGNGPEQGTSESLSLTPHVCGLQRELLLSTRDNSDRDVKNMLLTPNPSSTV